MTDDTIKRLSPEEEQGRIKGGKILTKSTLITGGYPTTSSSHQGTNYSLQNKEQIEALINYANDNDLWYHDHSILGTYIDNGDEQYVYVRPEQMTVYKVNDLYFHETPIELFDRLAIHNHLFPEAPYEMLGFTYSTKEKFSVVLKQPFVVAERGARREEVVKEMNLMGYTHRGGTTFTNDDYIVEDLHPGNVLKLHNGMFAFIDPVIYLNTPEEGMGGTRELYQG